MEDAKKVSKNMNEKVIYENYNSSALGKFSEKWPRQASRGVVYFSDSSILIFLKKKIGQYKLPGGGKEDNEKPEETFIREVHEETGYRVKNIQKVGITNEYTQISHVFIAEPDGGADNPHPDKAEIIKGAKCLKMAPKDALLKIKKFTEKYEGKNDNESLIRYDITLRDYKILEYICNKLFKN